MQRNLVISPTAASSSIEITEIDLGSALFAYNNVFIALLIRFTNISARDICFSSLLKISPHSNFKHIFIRHYLPDSTRLLGKVLYHALKQKLTPILYKVFFNNRSQTFELRDKKNPLSYPPFLIPESDLTKWFDSFDYYKKSFINNSSSQA